MPFACMSIVKAPENDNLHLLTGVIKFTIYVSVALQVVFGRRRDVHSIFVYRTGPLIIHPTFANLSSIKSRGCTYRFFGKARRVCLLPSMYKFLSCISWHSCACALVRRVHSHSLVCTGGSTTIMGGTHVHDPAVGSTQNIIPIPPP